MTQWLDYISTWSILKWVILVLIAGFIGQFGRMMAEAITARVRERRVRKGPSTEKTSASDVVESPPADIAKAGTPSQPVGSMNLPDKKALKALAKARKKEAKNR